MTPIGGHQVFSRRSWVNVYVLQSLLNNFYLDFSEPDINFSVHVDEKQTPFVGEIILYFTTLKMPFYADLVGWFQAIWLL